ncbi:MAG: putative MFS family arabinose efflux permease [Planctomycetota bacterium]|jgi:predicted MFS family arabinose efflux permease
MDSNLSLNSRATVSTAILFCVVGAAAFLIMPLLIGVAAEDFQLSESQLGFLAALLMSGSAISALLAVFWVRRVNWHKAMYIAALTLTLAHGFAILATDYTQLFLAIFIASLGGGTAYSLAITILSDNDNPDQVFGYCVAAQVAFQIVGLLLLPGIISSGGLDAVLMMLSALAFLSLFAIRFLPIRGKETKISNVMQVFTQSKVVFALLGCLFFFFNVGCFWTFIERMGDAAGYSAQVIGNSLAAGVSVGIIGSLCASWLGNRYGRLRQLFISAVGTVLTAVLLSNSDALTVYVIAIALYNFVWNYSLVYQYAVISAVDDSGRGVAMAPAFHAAGAAMGPAIAGVLVTTNNFMAINALVATSVIISLLFFIPACKGENT